MPVSVGDILAQLDKDGVVYETTVSPNTILSAPVDWGAFSGSGLAFYVYKNAEALKKWQESSDGLIICNNAMKEFLPDSGPYLFTEFPRLAFLLAAWTFVSSSQPTGIHPTAVIGPNARIGQNVSIGPFCVIGDAKIGDNSTIGSHVSISEHVELGADAKIMNGAHLGTDGLGSLADNNGGLKLFPHFERVLIGDKVVIGPCSVVFRGVLKPTVIGSHCHISMHCGLGHNVQLGERVFCAPGVTIAGSVTVKDDCYLGQRSTIKEGLVLPERTTVGLNVALNRNPKGPGETYIGSSPKNVGPMFGWGRS